MLRALLPHTQEAQHRRHLVQPTDTTRTQYAKCRLCSDPGNEQVMFETCIGP
jgi:hypothetical protein